ncbi:MULTISPECIES: MFS transporter [unclassified Moorena]|uniref:MFS transporter n=1 Tax=unclassified Moorena TaxID=2683338 RepID=UPI0025F90B02|nr:MULTISPECIES: MFS transporter [unclassified Moorena]
MLRKTANCSGSDVLINQMTDIKQSRINGSSFPIINAFTKQFTALEGMEIFSFIWLSQVVSLLGSRLTSFAISIWVYSHTDSVTLFSLPILSTLLPTILISPIAGVYIDRWNRRWTMIISDFCAGLSTLIVAWLYVTGHLELWHICLTNILRSSFSTFQELAYLAATSLLVPKDKLIRANSMMQTSQAISKLIGPALAAALLGIVQFEGIVAIDFITLAFALVSLLIVKFPEIAAETEQQTEHESFMQSLALGWNYCKERSGLLWLTFLLTVCNFLIGAHAVLEAPLILSFASVIGFGLVVSCSNVGMVAGGLVAMSRGGKQNQMRTILIGMALIGLSILLEGIRPSIWLVTISSFCLLLPVPLINSSIISIFQRKVAPELLGRVLALLRSVARSGIPISFLLAGFLADHYFERFMSGDNPGARLIGQAIGVGPGRGIGLLYICMGILTLTMTCIAYFLPRLRYLEDELPDVIGDDSSDVISEVE